MEQQQTSGNHYDKAAKAARIAGAAARIAKAAAAGGPKGALVAAGVETLPFLFKLLFILIILICIVPMLIFTALPHILFGFSDSTVPQVMELSQKAMEIGGVYMSLEEFEDTYMDGVVTSQINAYEEEGTDIDEVLVESDFKEEDLLWVIAINSVLHQQNLNEINSEGIENFSLSQLTYTPVLDIVPTGDDTEKTVLKIVFERVEPTELMDSFGFDEEAKNWANALYETMKEADFLTTYGPYFDAYEPSYDGDPSYGGEIVSGGEADIAIDTSAFVSPETKNNLDLAAYAIQAWENGWGYVWGTYGNVLTESLLAYKLQQYPDGVGSYESFIRENWLGGRTADCVGLIKGYGWLDPTDSTISYATNGMPDYGANQMYRSAVEYGPMRTMPEIKGLAVWKEGHIGVYIGDGYVIEAMGTRYGVVKTKVAGRGWQGWCKIPFIDYIEEE